HARRHVVLVLARVLVFTFEVSAGLEVRAEKPDVRLGIRVSDRLVRIETQHLVIADRERHLLVDVRLEKLSGPVAVIGADESDVADVVYEAREDDFLAHAVLLREPRALEQVDGGREAMPEEIEKR